MKIFLYKKNLFVTLGKYGKVSKNLGKEFVKNDLEYESISWKDINNKGLLSKLINLRSAIKNKYNDILFIDCLIGSNNYIEESNLHLNNLKETKKIFPNSIYIFSQPLNQIHTILHHTEILKGSRKSYF